eukprot:s1791_g21.t1
MDPTEAELSRIANLADAMNWAGVDGDLRENLLTALGTPTRVREITLIPRLVWDQTVYGLQMPQADAPTGLRDVTPVEMARVESLRRVCNLRVGREADDSGTQLMAAPVVPGPPFPPMGGASQSSGQRKIKLSAVLDPTLDADIIPLSEQEVTNMYDQYRAKFGSNPSSDTDVSRDQLP